MTGRGIDQALPNPGNPRLRESFVHDARDYVALAEQVNGPIARPVGFSYVWGIALEVLDDLKPDARIINLETSIATSNDFWPDKGIQGTRAGVRFRLRDEWDSTRLVSWREQARHQHVVRAICTSGRRYGHVDGHSSHHAKGMEIYRARPIVYGCGDLLNDYEGISGHDHYRGDLSLLYFVMVDSEKHEVSSIQIVPAQRCRFRLVEASADDAQWLAKILDRAGREFGTRVYANADKTVGWRGRC